MPVLAAQEAASLWGQWRVAHGLSISDPRALAVTPEQALLDLEVMNAVRAPLRVQTNEEWFEEQERLAAEKAAREAAMPEAMGIPSRDEGNADPDAAYARLMAWMGRGEGGPGPQEVVSLEG